MINTITVNRSAKAAKEPLNLEARLSPQKTIEELSSILVFFEETKAAQGLRIIARVLRVSAIFNKTQNRTWNIMCT